jgi:hypothetical protein
VSQAERVARSDPTSRSESNREPAARRLPYTPAGRWAPGVPEGVLASSLSMDFVALEVGPLSVLEVGPLSVCAQTRSRAARLHRLPDARQC